MLTINEKFESLASYCTVTKCNDCKIMARYNTCKMIDLIEKINDIFNTVNNFDSEIEKAGRSANQSAK